MNKIPNILTALRLVLCPILVILFTNKNYLLLIFIYSIQEFLDQADGKIASYFKLKTTTGKYFDPFVDSLTHLTAFACLMTIDLVPLWMFFIFLVRELGMMFVRLLAVLVNVDAGGHISGKLKALVHAVVIFVCFFTIHRGENILFATDVWLLFAVTASVGSGLFYLYKYRSVLKKSFA